MKKKLILAAASALSIFTLAACSKPTSEAIVTMKGGKITVEDFFDEAKTQATSQQLVQNMVVFKVMENAYGDKVTDKQIQEKYDETAKQYGDAFETVLKSSGLTEKTFKDQIKKSLAFEAGLKAHVKLTDEDLKAAWASFHPEVEAQIIMTASEDDANAALKEINDGKDFAEVAKSTSTDTTTKNDGGKVKFDSQSTTIPAAVQTAAYALKDGEVSKVITVPGNYGNSFYIVKMIKNKAKGNSMDPYKKELEKIATNDKIQNSNFQTTVIKEELKKANVKVKDKAFDSALSQYLTTSSSSSATTKDSSTKDSSTKDSSKKSEDSTATTKSSTTASTETTTSSSK